MQSAIFAVAQISNIRDSVLSNIDKHLFFIEKAADAGAQYILFPEMSLTGYEREAALRRHFQVDDKLFSPFQRLSSEKKIIITAGAPIKIDDKLYICSLIFYPDKNKEIYIKQYLHPGEETVFSVKTDFVPTTELGGEKIANAICFDIENDAHVRDAARRNPTFYAASIFYSEKGINSGLQRLKSIAEKNNIGVLMSNYCGICWETKAGGKSSIWASGGELVIQAPEDKECLLIAERTEREWKASLLLFETSRHRI